MGDFTVLLGGFNITMQSRNSVEPLGTSRLRQVEERIHMYYIVSEIGIVGSRI